MIAVSSLCARGHEATTNAAAGKGTEQDPGDKVVGSNEISA